MQTSAAALVTQISLYTLTVLKNRKCKNYGFNNLNIAWWWLKHRLSNSLARKRCIHLQTAVYINSCITSCTSHLLLLPGICKHKIFQQSTQQSEPNLKSQYKCCLSDCGGPGDPRPLPALHPELLPRRGLCWSLPSSAQDSKWFRICPTSIRFPPYS